MTYVWTHSWVKISQTRHKLVIIQYKLVHWTMIIDQSIGRGIFRVTNRGRTSVNDKFQCDLFDLPLLQQQSLISHKYWTMQRTHDVIRNVFGQVRGVVDTRACGATDHTKLTGSWPHLQLLFSHIYACIIISRVCCMYNTYKIKKNCVVEHEHNIVVINTPIHHDIFYFYQKQTLFYSTPFFDILKGKIDV